MNSEQVLEYMIELLLEYVDELFCENNDFCYGERTAYTECLEIIQYWKKAKFKGLDFDIEKKYPL